LQLIISDAVNENIIAVPADEDIIAVSADKYIISRLSIYEVIAASTGKIINICVAG